MKQTIVVNRCSLHLAMCLGFAAVFAFSGCRPDTNSNAAAQQDAVSVVATVGMVADLVRYVGGDQITVTQLMGAGVDPHLYKPTRDDVQRITDADVVFYSGLMLEGRLTDILEKLSRKKPVVAITTKLSAAGLITDAETGEHPDPHVWMDISAWSSCLDVIVATLAQQIPSEAMGFQSRADELRMELSRLHDYGIHSLATIPEAQRVLVTSHDAFSYFGRAYGLEVLGVQGISTDSEAGLQRINELVDLLVQRQISAVFVESSVPQKNIQALIEGAESRGHHVAIGGELFSDAMGAGGTYEGTYIGMLDHNITLVTRALGGTAPEAGLNGKLDQAEAK
ncbi:MAG: metal ABC transporter solute-binding protein, Zn/Mn family [Planctomycetota bacterium]